MSGNTKAIEALNDLIATCRDSEAGFGKAAKGAHSDDLRNRLTGIGVERSDFADELAQQVRSMGGEPAASGHLSGIQHRGWRELETSVRPKNDAAFISECEAGEENTRRHYEHALTVDLPSGIRSIVLRQHAAVQEALAELASMELRRAV